MDEAWAQRHRFATGGAHADTRAPGVHSKGRSNGVDYPLRALPYGVKLGAILRVKREWDATPLKKRPLGR